MNIDFNLVAHRGCCWHCTEGDNPSDQVCTFQIIQRRKRDAEGSKRGLLKTHNGAVRYIKGISGEMAVL